jgi:hypothetical protein
MDLQAGVRRGVGGGPLAEGANSKRDFTAPAHAVLHWTFDVPTRKWLILGIITLLQMTLQSAIMLPVTVYTLRLFEGS